MSAKNKLFLSRRVVTELEIFDGGVFVNKQGIIKNVLSRSEVDLLLQKQGDNIEVIDGGNLALLAGVVDSHVHINEPGRTAWEGFHTASAAAAVGGVTTLIDMPLNSIPPTTTLSNLEIKAKAAKGKVYVDVGFWGGVIPGNQDHLRELIEAGVVGFKCFLCPSGVDEFPNVSYKDLEKAFEVLSGTETVLAFHAELEDESQDPKPCIPDKDPEQYGTYLATRPCDLEINAVHLIREFLTKTDVRVHIVHVSAAEVIPLLEEARRKRKVLGHKAWRAGVTAETCYHYLTLSAKDVARGHSEYKCAPPIRDSKNKEKLWQYIAEDRIDLVVSDHSPCTADLKCSDNLKAWGGISSVQFGLSLFWTHANSRGFNLNHVTRYLSSGPAKLCGIQHRKGALKPGLDADLVFFDTDATFVVEPGIIRYKNKVSPYLGSKLRGVVMKTFLRGQMIYSNGDIIGSPQGELLLNLSI